MRDPARGPARPILAEMALVLLACVLLSDLILLLDLDRAVARSFYQPDSGARWWGKGIGILDLVYTYGTWPALAVGGGGLLAFLLSFAARALRPHRWSAFFLAAVLAIGPGLLVNAVLKENWGRPRPRQVVEFGGTEPFHRVGAAHWGGAGESFPSGHASMGVYFVGPYILWRRRRRRMARAALLLAVASSLLLGFQRIASGSHWLSDVVWSWGTVHLTALGLAVLMARPGGTPTAALPRPPTR